MKFIKYKPVIEVEIHIAVPDDYDAANSRDADQTAKKLAVKLVNELGAITSKQDNPIFVQMKSQELIND